MRQVSRRWFDKLKDILTSAGYTPTKSDPCLYRRLHKGKETLVSVVVDDMLIASDNSKEAKRVIKKLRKTDLDTKDLGAPSYVIGIHIKRHANGDISLTPTSLHRNTASPVPYAGRQHLYNACEPDRNNNIGQDLDYVSKSTSEN